MKDAIRSMFNRFTGADDPGRLIEISDALPEPEAMMLQDYLRQEGIGAAIQNRGLPPYTSTLGSHYSLWVQARDEHRARELLEQGEHEE